MAKKRGQSNQQILMSVPVMIGAWLISKKFPMAIDNGGVPGKCTVSINGTAKGIWFFERIYPNITIDEYKNSEIVPSYGFRLIFNDDGDNEDMRLQFFHVKLQGVAAQLAREIKTLTSRDVQVELVDTAKEFSVETINYLILDQI